MKDGVFGDKSLLIDSGTTEEGSIFEVSQLNNSEDINDGAKKNIEIVLADMESFTLNLANLFHLILLKRSI